MIATSATEPAIGPAVSWLCAIGIMPCCDSRPSVGFRPTMPVIDAGQVIEPSVSDPMLAGAMPAATATALPELDPQGVRSSTYGFRVSPPIALQPLVAWAERKLAHSLKLVLPRMTAPAARNAAATGASAVAKLSTSASDPAVVG